VSSGGSASETLRARLAAHGYHVFLRPDRPTGWFVTIRDGADGTRPPVTARAATRDEAVALADRLFTSHRLTELDALVRDAGLTPPFWGDGGQDAHLDALEAFARANRLGAAAH
jgi:hypothetical protein